MFQTRFHQGSEGTGGGEEFRKLPTHPDVHKQERTLQYGAFQAVNTCMGVKPNEKVFIITDRSTEKIGSALYDEAVKATKNPDSVKRVILEDYGQRPFNKGMPPQLEADLRKFNPDVTFYAGSRQEGEMSFRKPLLELLTGELKVRHGHMIGVTEEIMKDGMSGDYTKVREMSQKVFDIVRNAEKIKVTTAAGTNLTAEFNPNPKWVDEKGEIHDRWVNSNAIYHEKGKWGNLPDGEVFTCPLNVNGTVVIDGVLGDDFSKYGPLKHPVTVRIENSRAVIDSVSCEDKVLEADFKKYLQRGENSDRVGEFAIGTNIWLTKLIGIMLQDEKFPGVHIAFGNSYKDETGSGWEAKTHVDGVLLKPTVEVDGKRIMENGRFTI